MENPICNQQYLEDIQNAFLKAKNGEAFQLEDALEHPFPLQIHRIEDTVRAFGGSIPPNRINHHVLAFLTRGQGRKIIGCHHFDVEDSMALIIPANQLHATPAWSLENRGYMLSFEESFPVKAGLPPALLGQYSLFRLDKSPCLKVPDALSPTIESLFQGIVDLKEKPQLDLPRLLSLKIAELISVYSSLFTRSKDHPFSRYSELLALLEENFILHREVSFYSGKMNLHPNYLSAVVKKESGLTVSQLIQQRLLLEIQYYLHGTNLSGKEIAYKLQFSDYPAFSKFFKKHSGLSPTAYRQSLI